MSFGKATIKSAMLRGTDAVPVEVEASVGRGLPGFQIVGMTDDAAVECKLRVKAAIKSAGFAWPEEKVLVNLAPASLRKAGASFDLAIVAAILTASGQIEACPADVVFVGETQLDGRVRRVRGAYCYADWCLRNNCGLVLSEECEVEGDEWGGRVRSIANVAALRTHDLLPHMHAPAGAARRMLDYADIAGHDAAARACQVAVAGNLNILFVGADNVSSMLATRLTSIMPDMTDEERRECACAHSAGYGCVAPISMLERPFRSPHHSSTLAGLVGGGRPVCPGEVTLAHNGVLFLEDVNEFSPAALQAIRQPLDEGFVRIVRTKGIVEMPANFLLAAHAQPCPCGKFGTERECTCSAEHVMRYQSRTAGPLADKINMTVNVTDAPRDVFAPCASSSEFLRAGVEAAKAFKAWRFEQGDREDTARQLVQASRSEDIDWFEGIAEERAWSGRQIVNTLRIARTIADMEESESVTNDHLVEAMAFSGRA